MNMGGDYTSQIWKWCFTRTMKILKFLALWNFLSIRIEQALGLYEPDIKTTIYPEDEKSIYIITFPLLKYMLGKVVWCSAFHFVVMSSIPIQCMGTSCVRWSRVRTSPLRHYLNVRSVHHEARKEGCVERWRRWDRGPWALLAQWGIFWTPTF